MRTTEHTTKTPSAPTTGFFAMLRALSGVKGTRAPSPSSSRGTGAPSKLPLFFLPALVLAILAFSATPALASSAWWHVSSNPRPAYLHSLGLPNIPAVDEVEKVTVKATGGTYALEEPAPGSEKSAVFGYNASAAEVQEGLEKHIYGAGNVSVAGSCKEAKPPVSECEYEVTFEGALAGQAVGLASAEGYTPFFLEGELTITQITAAKPPTASPDGTIVASAFNAGDTGARECVRVPAGGKFKDAACSEAAVPGHEEYEQDPAKLVDRLPAGLRAVSVEGGVVPGGAARLSPIPCKIEEGEPQAPDKVVVCSLTGLGIPFGAVAPPFEPIEVRIGVVVEAGAHTGEENEVSLSGAGAPPKSSRHPLTFSSEPVPFGAENYELTPEDEGGGVDTQAGSHPFQTSFTVTENQLAQNNTATSGLATDSPAGLPRDVYDNFPPGLIGNPVAVGKRCTSAQFLAEHNECPAASVVGVAVTTINEPAHDGIIALADPVFNLEPSAGEPARFGFVPNENSTPVYLGTSVRTGGDYGITVPVTNITQAISFLSSVVTIWGVPGEPVHNETRDGCLLATARGQFPICELSNEHNPPPFFELPTQCTGVPLQSSIEEDSWEEPGDFATHLADLTGEPGGFIPASPADGNIATTFAHSMPTLDGCNRLPFKPSIRVTPDGQAASTATGLTVDVHVPQDPSLNAKGLGESDPRNITVTLPEGLALNPSDANGLEACTPAQIGFTHFAELNPATEPGVRTPQFTSSEPSCPAAAKVANATITTPVLPVNQPLKGAVYLASPQNFSGMPQENPFSSLVAMYIVARDPISGILVKLAGSVSLNESTGQITATFDNSPQAPFEDAELEFFGGERAPLTTPAKCGTYTASASFTSWSSSEPVGSSSSFNVTSGPATQASPAGTPCPGQSLPFTPSLTSGSPNINAGSFSPLTTTISREDGQQQVQNVTLHYPPGMSGILAGIPLCPEAQANAGTCPESSRIGETIVSVGVGGDPFTVTGGKVYLTEKYAGAPFGLSIVNPAKAGPFNLQEGKPVIVRAKIEIDPRTAALTITTGNIPHILDGFPLQIKHVNVLVNRPGFTFNPTSCNPMEITGSIGAWEGATSPVSDPFQVTNCAALKYTPTFTTTTAGKASKTNGASLTFKIVYPKNAMGSQAWFNYAKFDIPKQLPARLTTIQKACLAATFEHDRSACPPASIIGHAVVHTQVLPVPLEGSVYFVSYGGAAFPDAVLVLQGDGVTIELHGKTFIEGKTGKTSATFESLPDVPFESIEVSIPQGPYSEFGANLPKEGYNFCGQNLKMPVAFRASNGLEIHQETPVSVTGCPPAISITKTAVKGNSVAVTVKLGQGGTVKITGKGVKTVTKKGVKAGTHTITVPLTAAGRAAKKHKAKLKIQASLTVGRSTGTATTTLKA